MVKQCIMPETNQKNNGAHFSKSKATYERNPEKKYGAKFLKITAIYNISLLLYQTIRFLYIIASSQTPNEHSKQHVNNIWLYWVGWCLTCRAWLISYHYNRNDVYIVRSTPGCHISFIWNRKKYTISCKSY